MDLDYSYAEGFYDKCSQAAVDPAKLLKEQRLVHEAHKNQQGWKAWVPAGMALGGIGASAAGLVTNNRGLLATGASLGLTGTALALYLAMKSHIEANATVAAKNQVQTTGSNAEVVA